MTIHFGAIRKLEAHTACGLNFNLMRNACLTGDPDSVDCKNCLRSNTYLAHAMESSLITLIDARPFPEPTI